VVAAAEGVDRAGLGSAVDIAARQIAVLGQFPLDGCAGCLAFTLYVDQEHKAAIREREDTVVLRA
jgi:uncharacterized membrane protein